MTLGNQLGDAYHVKGLISLVLKGVPLPLVPALSSFQFPRITGEPMKSESTEMIVHIASSSAASGLVRVLINGIEPRESPFAFKAAQTKLTVQLSRAGYPGVENTIRLQSSDGSGLWSPVVTVPWIARCSAPTS